jgi:hypothetical protein
MFRLRPWVENRASSRNSRLVALASSHLAPEHRLLRLITITSGLLGASFSEGANRCDGELIC